MLLKIKDCVAYTLDKFKDSDALGIFTCIDNSLESMALTKSDNFNVTLLKNPPLEIVDFANGAAICGRRTLSVLHSQGKHNEIIRNILTLNSTLCESSFKHINILIDNDFSNFTLADEFQEEEYFNNLQHKIFLPSNPYDFCSFLKISLESSLPSFFLISPDIFEVKGPVPNFDDDPLTDANAQIRKEAKDISIIATGEDIFEACNFANNITKDAEIIETRVISPLDIQTLKNSILKTKCAKIIQTDNHLDEFNKSLCSKLKVLCKDAVIDIEKIQSKEAV